MKKKEICFSLLSAIALSSCATDLYQNNPVQSSEREISFKTFADKQLRASVTTGGSMTSFTTSAWSHPDAAVSTANPYNGYVLNGVTVTRGEDGGATWDYFPKANWPAKDSVDFFAYSPASSVNVTTGLKQAPSVTTPPAAGPEIKYTVPLDQQEDFLVTKSVDLTYTSSPTVHLNFKHALSRIVFKAQNQNKNKTYVIKELALSNLKSKGTLNMLDSVPDATNGFQYAAGYKVSWKAQFDSVTYKVDLGNTNVYVPYSTGTASGDYTAVTNASNGLMVLPQETVLGAFSGSTPEYGTVAEIDGSLPDATYLYATVAEVDYLTNDTVNTRQVVFRLHDPANKAQGIVFEAGKQYTFLLTLGLDGAEIVFSIPTVTPFNESAVVDAPKVPFPCGTPFKGYNTANYSNAGLTDLCWTTTNIAESTANSVDTYPSKTLGERGYYYPWDEAADACAALGAEWSVPNTVQWTALINEFSTLTGSTGTTGTTAALQSVWNSGTALAGGELWGKWDEWDKVGAWWSSGTADEGLRWSILTNDFYGPINFSGNIVTVRCVRSL
ncbi:hypothetical protein AGMMS49525_10450 [Bacteroidia bacterium]|nr:hypothetical protein AGMMS49525_10450 [Bacteroidia bacterium]